LIVEILSSGTARRDRVEKAQLYARHGARHYWLVDPDAKTIETLELVEGRYHRTAHLASDATFEPSIFPGLTISLSSLWG
jgi:Uma2 family endonuclease